MKRTAAVRPVGGVKPTGPLVARSCSTCGRLTLPEQLAADRTALFGKGYRCLDCTREKNARRRSDPRKRQHDADVEKMHKQRAYANADVRLVYVERSARRAAADPEGRRGYNRAHARVRRANGSASDRVCVDCGSQAREWSLRPDAHTLCKTELYTWSDSPADYDARCTPCHRKLDAATRRSQ